MKANCICRDVNLRCLGSSSHVRCIVNFWSSMMYYVKAQTEMVEQSLPGPGRLRWYKKENKNVRNLRLHNESLMCGSIPTLHISAIPTMGIW